ncbi:MAG TPA: 1,2-phenylacetyl-CoA epoxidase subunit PaaC [Candidatus Competibacteraceae bacterium]|nr:1,2-phenylacetyl-CoA epoxidase subunit PaaC [Candidatus Competibacteraceae bacterium]
MPTTLSLQQALFEYALRLGDTSLILSHRLSEWCSHAPELEEEVALMNIALDLIGQARALLTYAGEVEDKGRDEDALAYHRDERDWRNLLLVEQPNGDFAQTMARQFLYDAFAVEFYGALRQSRDERLAAIAAKALKEVSYHLRHSSQWVLRLGDGTDESHRRMQHGIDELWQYTGELFRMDEVDRMLIAAGIAVDLEALRPAWNARVGDVLSEATLIRPADAWMQDGGKLKGLHSEHLGRLLAEMQFVQRAYPGLRW